MQVALIAAMSRNGVIGKEGRIPWRLPNDLRRFASLTRGHPVIMGRKTHDSIIERNGRILPNRSNIILSRSSKLEAPDCLIAHTLEEALRQAEKIDSNIAFVIGGGEIYEVALPIADALFLTTVEIECEGDTFFPKFDQDAWYVESCESTAGNPPEEPPQTFTVYTKNQCSFLRPLSHL